MPEIRKVAACVWRACVARMIVVFTPGERSDGNPALGFSFSRADRAVQVDPGLTGLVFSDRNPNTIHSVFQIVLLVGQATEEDAASVCGCTMSKQSGEDWPLSQ